MREVGFNVRNAIPAPLMVKLVPMPEVVLRVTVVLLSPASGGVKVTSLLPLIVQELPELKAKFAVQEPGPTLKSVESELLKGEALKVTGPPDAVKVMAPVQ